METVFLKLLNLSITAGWLVLALLVCRLLFKKAPRVLWCLMWGLVAVRLVLPFSVESGISLIPSAQTVPEQILYASTPAIDSGIPLVDSAVNGTIGEALTPDPGDSVNPIQVLTHVAALVWLIGMAVLLVCAALSYRRVKRQVGEAVPLRDRLWQCDRIASPFILGLIHPRIYLPSDLGEEDAAYVIAHEQAHLHRRDHWWKPFGFLLLTVYWFHPLMWVGYWLLCRDIEYACDEKVLKEQGTDFKKGYSTALINCNVTRRSLAVCPLAFGEVGVKDRVKQALHYKKPAFWIVLAAVTVSVAVAVCFITDPVSKEEPAPEIQDELKAAAQADEYGIAMKVTSASPVSVTLTMYQHKTDHPMIYGEYYAIERLNNGEWERLDRLPAAYSTVWPSIAYTIQEGQYQSVTISSIPQQYGRLAPGDYRILKQFINAGESTPRVEKTYYATFSVGWDDASLTGDSIPYSNTEPVNRMKTVSPNVFGDTFWVPYHDRLLMSYGVEYQTLKNRGAIGQLRYANGRYYSVTPLSDGSFAFVLYGAAISDSGPALYVIDAVRLSKLADAGSVGSLRVGMSRQEVLDLLPAAYTTENDRGSIYYLTDGSYLIVRYQSEEDSRMTVKHFETLPVFDGQVMHYLLPMDRELIS